MKLFEEFIAEKVYAGFKKFNSIKKGNIIEYNVPGTGTTSTGKIIDKGSSSGHNYVILIDDNSLQKIKVFINDNGIAYEN